MDDVREKATIGESVDVKLVNDHGDPENDFDGTNAADSGEREGASSRKM